MYLALSKDGYQGLRISCNDLEYSVAWVFPTEKHLPVGPEENNYYSLFHKQYLWLDYKGVFKSDNGWKQDKALSTSTSILSHVRTFSGAKRLKLFVRFLALGFVTAGFSTYGTGCMMFVFLVSRNKLLLYLGTGHWPVSRFPTFRTVFEQVHSSCLRIVTDTTW